MIKVEFTKTAEEGYLTLLDDISRRSVDEALELDAKLDALIDNLQKFKHLCPLPENFQSSAVAYSPVIFLWFMRQGNSPLPLFPSLIPGRAILSHKIHLNSRLNGLPGACQAQYSKTCFIGFWFPASGKLGDPVRTLSCGGRYSCLLGAKTDRLFHRNVGFFGIR